MSDSSEQNADKNKHYRYLVFIGRFQPFHCGHKAVVDEALANVFKSGEINTIYDKWFMNPIPPKNVNLKFEMSDNLKALIANPHDSDQPKVATAQ